MANDAKVWLITGSSTGFGRSLAEAVLEKGDRARLMLGVDAFGRGTRNALHSTKS